MIEVFTSKRCLAHEAPAGYPETAERLSAIVDHLMHHPADDLTRNVAGPAGQRTRAVHEVDEHPQARRAIDEVHADGYAGRFRAAVERGDGLLDSADNPLSPGTWSAALAAVEVCLTAADRVIDGTPAFAAVRPPGHHAERAMAMGFCYFANIAITTQYLLRRHRLGRVAIVDFDVHHGNGTQHAFEDREDVLFVSTHQSPFYPGTGAAGERGIDRGEGMTINLPLPAGTTDEAFLGAFDTHAAPAIRSYRPAAILVSAGFDAWQDDPLGGFLLTEGAFEAIGERLGRLAREVSGGRFLALLEGGYDIASLPALVDRFLDGAERGLHG